MYHVTVPPQDEEDKNSNTSNYSEGAYWLGENREKNSGGPNKVVGQNTGGSWYIEIEQQPPVLTCRIV